MPHYFSPILKDNFSWEVFSVGGEVQQPERADRVPPYPLDFADSEHSAARPQLSRAIAHRPRGPTATNAHSAPPATAKRNATEFE